MKHDPVDWAALLEVTQSTRKKEGEKEGMETDPPQIDEQGIRLKNAFTHEICSN
jgi:hypothetical protein